MNERTSASARATNGRAARDAPGSSPALRDADAILARAADDEAAALDARKRYRDREMDSVEPDARIAELLAPGEEVLAVRRSALLDRREPPISGGRRGGCPGLAGDLYVTSSRIVHVGRSVLEYDLDAIREAIVSTERLLLILGDGTGTNSNYQAAPVPQTLFTVPWPRPPEQPLRPRSRRPSSRCLHRPRTG
jgi:hypothetical protein